MASRAGLIFGIVATVATPAVAQESGRASDRALAPFVACRQLGEARTKAACYDAALDRLQQSVATRTVVVVDREQAAVDRKAMFGFNGERAAPKPPRPPKLAKAAAAPTEDVAQVDSTIVSAQQYGLDMWTLRIATGAVWRTTEGGIGLSPRAGTPIRIRKGIMGGFMVRVGAARAVRAIRVG